MKLIPLLFLLLLLLPTASFAVEEKTIIVDGMERSYAVFAPKRPNRLLIVLHGGGGTKEKMMNVKLHEPAVRDGYAVVYPDAYKNHWNDGRKEPKVRGWDVRPDDIGFLRKLISKVSAEFGIPARRVYVTGPSNGGMMTFRVACELAADVAAVAPVISSMPEDFLPHCKPTERLPVLMINGRDDSLVPYEGGQVRAFGRNRGPVIPAETSLAFWAKHNRCRPDRKIVELPKQHSDDETKVRHIRYEGCDGADVEMYAVEGGGHRWFGGMLGRGRRIRNWLMGPNSREIDTNHAVLEFFSVH